MISDSETTKHTIFGFDVKETFRLTAEISSIVLLIGFALSSLLNQFVFDFWFLNFFSIASPTDVIMSGMGFLFDVSIILLAGGIGIFLMNFGTAKISRWLPAEAKVRQEKNPPSIGPIGFLTLAAALAPYWIGKSVENSSAWPISFESANFIAMAQFGYSLMMGGVAWRAISKLNADQKVARRFCKLFCFVGACGAILGLSHLVSLRGQLGYQRSLLEVPNSLAEQCGEVTPSILWIGTEFLVVRCGINEPPFAVRTGSPLQLVPAPGSGRCQKLGYSPFFDCRRSIGAGP